MLKPYDVYLIKCCKAEQLLFYMLIGLFKIITDHNFHSVCFPLYVLRTFIKQIFHRLKGFFVCFDFLILKLRV